MTSSPGVGWTMIAFGSRQHWQNRDSYKPAWDTRAERAARLIPPRSRVLDIGCGPSLALRRFLPLDCSYLPADLVPWTPEVQPVDVDANVFPDGRFDCIVLLGVIEYLRQPRHVFDYAGTVAQMMVVSFCHPGVDADVSQRRTKGWVNDFSETEFSALALAGGWSVTHSELYQEVPAIRQRVHLLRPAEPSIAGL